MDLKSILSSPILGKLFGAAEEAFKGKPGSGAALKMPAVTDWVQLLLTQLMGNGASKITPKVLQEFLQKAFDEWKLKGGISTGSGEGGDHRPVPHDDALVLAEQKAQTALLAGILEAVKGKPDTGDQARINALTQRLKRSTDSLAARVAAVTPKP